MQVRISCPHFRQASVLDVAGVAECVVSLGGLTDNAVVSTVMILAVAHHIVNLRAIAKGVGEDHGTHNGMVGRHGAA